MITCGFVYFYCTFYQGVSDEELGGAWELLKEGFMTSLAIFFVSQSGFINKNYQLACMSIFINYFTNDEISRAILLLKLDFYDF